MAQKLFYHPFIGSGTAIARITVCLATFLWGLVVLAVPATLSVYPAGVALLGWPTMFPATTAMVAMATALYQATTTLRWCPENRMGDAAAAMMVMLWTLVCLGLWAYARPLPAPAVASTTAVMFLSWWNLAAPSQR